MSIGTESLCSAYVNMHMTLHVWIKSESGEGVEGVGVKYQTLSLSLSLSFFFSFFLPLFLPPFPPFSLCPKEEEEEEGEGEE